MKFDASILTFFRGYKDNGFTNDYSCYSQTMVFKLTKNIVKLTSIIINSFYCFKTILQRKVNKKIFHMKL